MNPNSAHHSRQGKTLLLLLGLACVTPASAFEEPEKGTASQNLDIRAPGSDLANFPNSAFTLPQGGFYLETSPLFLASKSTTLAAQYSWEYLLRYGLTDDVELRLYSQGFSVQGNPSPATGFAPLTFDTKIHFWDEMEDWLLPAAGLEAQLQTTLLGSPAFNSGTEPIFSMNFDQSLPWDIGIEYNFGASRFQDPLDTSRSIWDATFAWAIQKEVFQDFDLFVNGYYNAANLPRIGRLADQTISACPHAGTCQSEEQVQQTAGLGGKMKQQAVGAGAIWTLGDQVSVFANVAFGVTPITPTVTAYTGFAWTP